MGTGSHDEESRPAAAPAPRCRERRAPRALTGAVEENRTPVASLARSHSTVELPPRVHRKKKEAGRRAPRARTSCMAAGRRPASATRRTNRQRAPWGGPKGEMPSGMVTHEHWPVRWSDEGSNLDPCRAKAVFSRLNYHPEPAVLASDLHHRTSIPLSPHILYLLAYWTITHRSSWDHRAPFFAAGCEGIEPSRRSFGGSAVSMTHTPWRPRGGSNSPHLIDNQAASPDAYEGKPAPPTGFEPASSRLTVTVLLRPGSGKRVESGMSGALPG